MATFIEEYRGWEISFDTDKESFQAISSEHDTQVNKLSFAAAKKYIDDFIKENNQFKPFQVMRDSSSWKSEKEITIVGIRKDGAFITQDKDGKKGQISKYSEGDYFLINEANTPIFNEIKRIKSERDALYEKEHELSKKLIKVTLKDIKPKYITVASK